MCNLEGKKNVRDVKIVVLKCLKAFRGRRIFSVRFRRVEGEIKKEKLKKIFVLI